LKHNLAYCLFLLPALLFYNPGKLSGQNDINSPYSYFGIGTIYNNHDAFNMSMGGLGIALSDHFYVNNANPASYHAFDTTSFVLEGGFFGSFVTSMTELQTVKTNDISLGYLLMGFPVTKWWKTSLGLTPYSYLGYSASDVKNLENIGRTSFDYTGSGGLNKAYWGNSLTFFKKFSVGMNASFLFGTLNYDKVVSFPDSIYMTNFRLRNSEQVQDFIFDFGAQYTARIKDIFLTAGLVYNATTKLNAKRDLLETTFFPGNDQVEYVKDTIVYQPGEKGTITYPFSLGGGIVVQDSSRWMAGAEFFWQNWKDYSSFGLPDSLANTMRFSIGGQYKPLAEGMSKYWQRIYYRVGFHYEQTYLKLRNNQINEFGVSFGVGLPLKGLTSTVNLGLEIGQSGTKNNGLIKENFFRFTVGVAMYERWFIKRKFY